MLFRSLSRQWDDDICLQPGSATPMQPHMTFYHIYYTSLPVVPLGDAGSSLVNVG